MKYVKSDGIPRIEVFGFDRLANLRVRDNAISKLKEFGVVYNLKIHTFFFDEDDDLEKSEKFIVDTLK